MPFSGALVRPDRLSRHDLRDPNHMTLRPLPGSRLTRPLFLFASLLTACQVADAQRGFVEFTRDVLDDTLQGGYGVEVADIDGDGRQDIVALSTNPARFVWFRNPDWARFDITTETQGNIATAPQDIDGDGDIDLVLAHDFALQRSTEGGTVHWLENPGNPTENTAWALHLIDAIPTAHRVKWADVNGDGRAELVNLPIIGVGAAAPDYAGGLEFTVYPIPPNPSEDNWPGVVIGRDLEMAHGITVVNWDDDDRQDLLVASFRGVDLYQLGVRGQTVARTWLGEGKTGERPAIGASEVGMGHLGPGRRFLATIEPWHGNEVVVYTPREAPGALWERSVIDTEFVDGHALVVADLDNDGRDEIVAGHRRAPYGLYIYRHDSGTGQWTRIDLDPGRIGVAGLVVEDFDNDGFKDIVGIGSATANVVLYRNRGR